MMAVTDFIFACIIAAAESFVELSFFTKSIGQKPKAYHYVLLAVISNMAVRLLPPSSLLRFPLYTLLLLFYGLFVLKADIKVTVLYAMITVEIISLCYGISKSFTGIISPILYPIAPDVMSLLFMTVSSILAILLAFLCYYIMIKYFSQSGAAQNQYVLIILIPLLMIFMLSEYIDSSVYGSTIILNDNGELLNANHLQMLAIQMFSVLSLFCIIYAYQKLIRSFWLNTRLTMLERESLYQSQYVSEAKLRYEKTKSFRHDMKNHLSVVEGLLEKGKVAEARKYLQDVKILTSGLSFPCHTNNPVLDILVGNKLGLAQSKGICTSCTLEVPYPCAISDTDFCIILSNALDNAIHACENMEKNAEKKIQVLGRRQGDFLLIEVKNTCSGKQFYKNGIGLSNVKAVAEKYNGALSTQIQDGVFTFSLLLILLQQSDNITQQVY